MDDATDRLMPGPEGKTPRFYEVDRGNKTESYISAVSGNPVVPEHLMMKERPIDGEPAQKKPWERPPTVVKKPKDPNQIGLNEEELEEYRNDPCWKFIRTFLFILFWLIWIALFAVAILLVFLSPACIVREKPNWWQTAVAYHVWVPSFQDSDGDGIGDVDGLINRLDQLRKSGIQTVWPSPFLISDDEKTAVRSFSQMDPKLGVNQKADELIEKLHEREMKIVISLPIATTSLEHEWFLNSASASKTPNANYSQFYTWVSKAADSNYFTEHKNLFYLHEKGNPKSAVLNWQNSNLREHMFNALSSWIDRGIDGFELLGIEYLARTPNGTEPEWNAIYDVIRDIRFHVDTYSNESKIAKGRKIALFSTREEAKEKDKKKMAKSGMDTVINYELGEVEKDTKICHKNEGSVATCVHEILSDVLLFHSLNEQVWPHWRFGSPDLSRVASRVGSRPHAQLLMMLQMVLPGTNNIYYGEEIGMRNLANDSKVAPQRGAMQWDETLNGGFSTAVGPPVPSNIDVANINWKRQYSEPQSTLKIFAKLAKLRQREDALKTGTTLIGRLVDGAFTITRFNHFENRTTGNIYVAALNFAEHPVKVPLTELPSHGKLQKSTIVTATSNCDTYYARQTVNFEAKEIELEPNQGVVFRYSA
uniref:Aamy domain-containing protein n=1 Tax=Caenorhabditis japonica TaxID=281687 RepID=A0A8R1I607_CAEJA